MFPYFNFVFHLLRTSTFLGNHTSYQDNQWHFRTITTSATHCIDLICTNCYVTTLIPGLSPGDT